MEKGKSLIEILTEDVRFTKEKVKTLLDKYKQELDRYQTQAKVIFNKITNTAFGDILDDSGFSSFKRLLSASEKFEDKLDSEWNKILELGDHMSEEYDESGDKEAQALYDEAGDLAHDYHDLSDSMKLLNKMCEGAGKFIEHVIEDDKLKSFEKFK